ncbi:MAG: CHAT domain-containing protein [Chloroflexi bacterium]|nr:CHAT domain-containing protein [Chloroflexota bacterium]
MSDRTIHFVDRDKELATVRELLDVLRAGDQIPYPLREYVGIGGIGKTALLEVVCEECSTRQLPYLLLDFAQLDITNPRRLIWKILDEVVTKLLWPNTSTAEKIVQLNAEISQALSTLPSYPGEMQLPKSSHIDEVLDLFTGFCGVLLFDTVERTPKEALEYLGQELIFPLSESKRILIVFGTRAQIDWGAPKYKIWRRTQTTVLRPFSPAETHAQLAGTAFEGLYEQIHSVTNGHPQSNDVVTKILERLEEYGYTRVSKEKFGDYEDRIIAAVVDEVIRKTVVVPESLFRAFCVLSILRYFDIDVPAEFLVSIDRSRNWSDPMQVVDLIRVMLRETDYIVRLDSERNSYAMDTFVRRALSLYMRLFYTDEYLALSKKAIEYYDQKLAKPPFKEYLIVEKLYHLADVLRMTEPRKYDVEIALQLRARFKNELKTAMAGIVYRTTQQEVGRTVIADPEERRRAFDRLRLELEQDRELNERLGDRGTPSFLVQALDEYQKELLYTGKATLDIVKYQSSGGEYEVEKYAVAFILSERNVDVTMHIDIPLRRKAKLLRDIKQLSSVQDLSDIGKTVRNQFLPRQIQEMLREHEGPLVIRVNDTAIPWELMHDGRDFVALRVPLGKRLRTVEEPKISAFREDAEIRVLLVGVPKSMVPGFPELGHVEGEISSLVDSLHNVANIDFNPAADALLGEDADSYEFLKRLSSGRYKVVHFAGHAIYDEEKRTGGLVLSDGVVSLEDIKRNVEGTPLVFLNACQSAVDEVVETRIGYVGSYTIGVASAFMLGGALGCIGSIWKVLDISGAMFALKFYRELLSGVAIGEALLRTKVQQRTDSPDDRIWATYVLFGDPTVKLALR